MNTWKRIMKIGDGFAIARHVAIRVDTSSCSSSSWSRFCACSSSCWSTTRLVHEGGRWRR